MPTADLMPVPRAAAKAGVSRKTLHRWITRGIDGLRLAAVRVGGHWKVDAAALEEFFAALSRQALPPEPLPVGRRLDTPSSRRRRSEAARDELRRMGVNC